MKCTNKVLLLVSLFALASCGGDSTLETSAVSEATQGVSDSEIILGSHTDLSGLLRSGEWVQSTAHECASRRRMRPVA